MGAARITSWYPVEAFGLPPSWGPVCEYVIVHTITILPPSAALGGKAKMASIDNPPYASFAAMFKTAVRHFDCVINRGC